MVMKLNPKEDTRALWTAYARAENPRVPISFACDEQVWLKVSGHCFKEFYLDPRIHLQAQLEGRRWFMETVPGDQTYGIPDRWDISVQLWMSENEYFKAPIVYQEDEYAWGFPLELEREDWIPYLRDLDLRDNILKSHTYRLYQDLKDLAQDTLYDGKPVVVHPPGFIIHGIFTKAAEIRGIETLCMDLMEAPDFAEEYLSLFTDRLIESIRIWRDIAGKTEEYPLPEGFHFGDDNVALLSEATYRRFVLPCHERLFTAMTTGERSLHLCGTASHLYAALVRDLKVTNLDGPGTFVDHGKFLAELGPKLRFVAQTSNPVAERGSSETIREMIRGLLTPAAKIPGRFQILGFITRDTPLENIELCYNAGIEYGRIEANMRGCDLG